MITCLIHLKPQLIGTYRKIYGIIADLRSADHDPVRIGFVAKPPASLAFRNLVGAPQHQGPLVYTHTHTHIYILYMYVLLHSNTMGYSIKDIEVDQLKGT